MHDILIICNHHRRSLFFEESMRILYETGIEDIFIQETGPGYFGFYEGPYSRRLISKNISHDAGMVNFKKQKLEDLGYKYIIKVDTDFFIHEASFILNLVNEADKGNFDFVTALKRGCIPSKYDPSKNLLFPIQEQNFIPTKEYPYFYPDPHYEGFCGIWSSRIWGKIKEDDFSHGRKLYKGLYENEGKIGVYYTQYRAGEGQPCYSQIFNGHIHLANIILFYYALEKNKFNFLLSDLSRLGYFYAQARKYGMSIYPLNIQEKLSFLSPYRSSSLEAWDLHTAGTCMQTYYR